MCYCECVIRWVPTTSVDIVEKQQGRYVMGVMYLTIAFRELCYDERVSRDATGCSYLIIVSERDIVLRYRCIESSSIIPYEVSVYS